MSERSLERILSDYALREAGMRYMMEPKDRPNTQDNFEIVPYLTPLECWGR